MVRTPFLSHLFSLPCSGVCPLVSSLSVNCCEPAPGPGGFRAPWGVCPCVSLGSGKGQNCRHTNWGCDKPAEGSGSAQQRILGLFWQELGAHARRWLQWECCSCRSAFPGQEWKEEQRGLETAWGCTSVPVSLGVSPGLGIFTGVREEAPILYLGCPSLPSGYSSHWRGHRAAAGHSQAGTGELPPWLQGHRRGSNSPQMLGSP